MSANSFEKVSQLQEGPDRVSSIIARLKSESKSGALKGMIISNQVWLLKYFEILDVKDLSMCGFQNVLKPLGVMDLLVFFNVLCIVCFVEYKGDIVECTSYDWYVHPSCRMTVRSIQAVV